MALLRVSNLEVQFQTREGVVKAVNGMNFEVDEGESLAIVGESGAGKSQLFLSFMGLLAENGSVSGEAIFRDKDLLQMKPRELNRIRGSQIAMIFQDPLTAFNPVVTIGGSGGRNVACGPDTGPGGTDQAVSARILRWHATKGHDCHWSVG